MTTETTQLNRSQMIARRVEELIKQGDIDGALLLDGTLADLEKAEDRLNEVYFKGLTNGRDADNNIGKAGK